MNYLGQHFEPLSVPDAAQIALSEMYLATLTCKPQTSEKSETRDKSPDPQGRHSSGNERMQGRTRNVQTQDARAVSSETPSKAAGSGKSRQQKSGSGPSIPTPDREVMQGPNPGFGDRKRLLEMVSRLPDVCANRIQNLASRLDVLLIDSQATIADMEQSERDADAVLRCVQRWSQNKRGGQYKINASHQYGLGRPSSSLGLWLRIISRKLLPFLRVHSFPHRPDFRVSDLIAFGSERYERIKESMVIACNQAVGQSPDVKKINLECWTVLFRAIVFEAQERVDAIGDDELRNIREWYDHVRSNVGHGVTHMGAVASRARAERKKEREGKAYIPTDEAIQIWLNSKEREDMLNHMENLAARLRAGERVQITSRTYLSFSEIAITELSIYSPVRIGAWVRMTMRAFVQAYPCWQTEGRNDTRNVQTMPSHACVHQLNARTAAAKVHNHTSAFREPFKNVLADFAR